MKYISKITPNSEYFYRIVAFLWQPDLYFRVKDTDGKSEEWLSSRDLYSLTKEVDVRGVRQFRHEFHGLDYTVVTPYTQEEVILEQGLHYKGSAYKDNFTRVSCGYDILRNYPYWLDVTKSMSKSVDGQFYYRSCNTLSKVTVVSWLMNNINDLLLEDDLSTFYLPMTADRKVEMYSIDSSVRTYIAKRRLIDG